MGVSCCFFGGDFNLSMEPYEHHDKSKFLYLREFKLVKSVKVKKKTESLS